MLERAFSKSDIQKKVPSCFIEDEYAQYHPPSAYKKILEVREGKVAGTRISIVSYRIDRIAYLKIPSFKKEELVKEDILPKLEEFKKEGVQSLILDLRGNTGGLVKVTAEFLLHFSPQKNVLMFKRRGREVEVKKLFKYFAYSRGRYADWEVIVLVDEKSASASEIVAGVFQRWGAKVFGTKTFRKGSIQSPIEIGGGVFYLTTDLYYFADGKPLEKDGITPDVFVKNDPETSGDEVLERAIDFLQSQQTMCVRHPAAHIFLFPESLILYEVWQRNAGAPRKKIRVKKKK